MTLLSRFLGKLRALEVEPRKRGVGRVAVPGSAARSETRADSHANLSPGSRQT